MVESGSTPNKRAWKRFAIHGVATALMRRFRLIEWGNPRYVEYGPIADISKGGMAIHYIANKKREFETSELAISVPNSGIVVAGIPFNVVMDVNISQLPDGKIIHKKGIQFGQMTSTQEFQLETFIKSHARG